MAALTETEQAEVLRFLGYANWEELASSYRWDYPTLVPTTYIVADAWNRLSDEGLDMVRRDLEILRKIEGILAGGALCRLASVKVGDITLNPNELTQLRQEWERWKQQLSDDLGAQINPYRKLDGSVGGRNGRVVNC